MNIWVDADACPVVIKDILFRAAERTGVQHRGAADTCGESAGAYTTIAVH